MLDSTTDWIYIYMYMWYHCKYSLSNEQTRQYFMVIFFQRHSRWRSLRAKFWLSLVTGISASGLLANVPVTRWPRYRLSHVVGSHCPLTKGAPITSVYCTLYAANLGTRGFAAYGQVARHLFLVEYRKIWIAGAPIHKLEVHIFLQNRGTLDCLLTFMDGWYVQSCLHYRLRDQDVNSPNWLDWLKLQIYQWEVF